MWLQLVVFSLLWPGFKTDNIYPSTWLADGCEPNLKCYPLKPDSFDEYAVELQSFLDYRDDLVYFRYHQCVKGKATPNLTHGGDGEDAREGHVEARHPIYMSNNKFFVQVFTERMEVITFAKEGGEITKDKNGRSCFRIMSEFKEGQHISPDNVKHSFVYKNYLFINSTTAIDLNKFMNFKEVEKLDTKSLKSFIPCRLDTSSYSYGMVPIGSIKDKTIHSLAKRLSSQCFNNATVFCSIDHLNGELVTTPHAVALRLGKFVMEQVWTDVIKDKVPIYRFRHLDMEPNEVFYFPEIRKDYDELVKNGKATYDMDNIFVRGIMPQPKLTDKIFKLMEAKTTPVPITTKKTTTTRNPDNDRKEDEERCDCEEKKNSSWRDFPSMTVMIIMMYFMIIE